MESRFLERPRETEIGSTNREFEKSEVKSDCREIYPRKTTSGSRNRGCEKSSVREIAIPL